MRADISIELLEDNGEHITVAGYECDIKHLLKLRDALACSSWREDVIDLIGVIDDLVSDEDNK